MAIPSQVYACDRYGLLWILDPTSLYGGTGWTVPLQPPFGQGILALAFDTGSNQLYAVGVPDGTQINMTGYVPVAVTGGYALGQMNPIAMPNNTFQPESIAVDPTHQRIFVADRFRCLSAWNTSNHNLTQISGSPYYPGSPSGGRIKAQGVAYDPNHNRVYTCAQNAALQDQLVVFDANSGPPMNQTAYNQTLYLSNSFTAMAYDTLNNRILITSSAGLIVIDATSATYTPITGSPFSLGSGAIDPRGIAFDATNSRIYVCNFGSDTLSVFNVTASSPYLTLMSGSPFPTGHGPKQVVYSASQNKVYVANFNGNPGPTSTAGGLTVFNGSDMSSVSTPTFLESLSFVSATVGP